MKIYIDGEQTGNLILNQSYKMPQIARKDNFVGKSFDPKNGYSYSSLDDLRFYNICLTQQEIIKLMNHNETSIFFLNKKYFLFEF